MDKSISAENFINYAVNTYSDTVYRVALNITHNPQDSFDISQEVFIRLVKNCEKIKSKEHLKAWLIRVTVNCSRSFMKSKALHETISIEDVRERDLLCSNEETPEITSLVWKLNEKYSVVIYLFYYEEMKISEIAGTLGISQSAVKLRLSRGREKLKNLIEKENQNG